MIRFSVPAAAASIAALAAADPVVVTFPLFDANGQLVSPTFYPQSLDSRLPDLLLGNVDAGGAGVSEVYPIVENNVPEWWQEGTSDDLRVLFTDNNDPMWWSTEMNTEAGVTVPGPNAAGDWSDPGVVMPWDFGMPLLRFYGRELYNSIPCDYREENTEIRELSPVLYYPLRVEVAESSYRHGWIAIQVIDIKSFVCDFPCEGDDDIQCMVPSIRWLGLGFETEADTPITVGGGLCDADLSPDAVLDLADLQAFVAAFIGAQPSGDLNGDGVFDLGDVQAFITAFNTGCGL